MPQVPLTRFQSPFWKGPYTLGIFLFSNSRFSTFLLFLHSPSIGAEAVISTTGSHMHTVVSGTQVVSSTTELMWYAVTAQLSPGAFWSPTWLILLKGACEAARSPCQEKLKSIPILYLASWMAFRDWDSVHSDVSHSSSPQCSRMSRLFLSFSSFSTLQRTSARLPSVSFLSFCFSLYFLS